MKNLTELKGNWNETKGKLKQKLAIILDSNLLLAKGKKEEMLTMVRSRNRYQDPYLSAALWGSARES